MICLCLVLLHHGKIKTEIIMFFCLSGWKAKQINNCTVIRRFKQSKKWIFYVHVRLKIQLVVAQIGQYE